MIRNPDDFDEIEGGDGDAINREIDREDFMADFDIRHDSRSDNIYDD